MEHKPTGVKRMVKACSYSYNGLRLALKNEAAFRSEIILALFLLPLAYWLPVTTVERVLLIMVVGIVLIVELINTAIEAVVDRVGSEHHQLSGMAKDVGSAAVLVSLMLCAFVWLSILLG